MRVPSHLFPPDEAGSLRRRSRVVAAAAVLALAFTATAVEPPPPPELPRAEADTTAISAASPAPTELGIAVAGALEAERSRVSALQALFDVAATDDAALAIQREIERVKSETELEILQIQARHARAAGRVEEADRIEAAARQLTEPLPVQQPVARPAPPEGRDPNAR